MQLVTPIIQLSLYLAFFLAGALTAHLSWQVGWLICLLGLPLIYRLSANKWQLVLGFFGYYLYGSHDLLHIIPSFYSGETEWKAALTYGGWIGWAVVLSLPYTILNKKSYLHFGLAILITHIPPLGMFHWLSMLTVAGELFPSMGYTGLLLSIILCSGIAVERRVPYKYLVLSAAVIALTNPVYQLMSGQKYLAAKAGGANNVLSLNNRGTHVMVSVETRLPHGGNTKANLNEMDNINHLKQEIDKAIASLSRKYEMTYMVLPEEVIGAWRPAKSLWWGRYVRSLADRNIYIIAGADLYENPSSSIFEDAAVMMLPEEGENGVPMVGLLKLTAAKLPMPGGNWNMFGLGEKRTAEMDVLGLKNDHYAWVDAQEIYFSICYEDFLLLPHLVYGLKSFVSGVQPSKTWVSMANNWFEDESMMSFKVQKMTIESNAKLFDAKLLRAINKKTRIYK